MSFNSIFPGSLKESVTNRLQFIQINQQYLLARYKTQKIKTCKK